MFRVELKQADHGPDYRSTTTTEVLDSWDFDTYEEAHRHYLTTKSFLTVAGNKGTYVTFPYQVKEEES